MVSVLFLTDDSGSTCFRDVEHLRMAGVRVGAWVKSFYKKKKKRIQNIQNYFFLLQSSFHANKKHCLFQCWGPRASCMLGKPSIKQATPSALVCMFGMMKNGSTVLGGK